MAPSEPNQNPFQGEFFSADLPQRFIREAIQNSLDARAGDDPVTVRFTISGPDQDLPPARAARYLSGLRPHFEAVVRAEAADPATDPDRRRALERRLDLFDGPLPYLAVEDFGTTGLRGDIRANDIRAQGNDFWGFFRSIGISPKAEDAGGSWGLGKWVFPDASKLNAFIGVTRRIGGERFLLMGQAMLRLHEIEGRKYPPVGFFAAGSDEADKDWLPMPAEASVPPPSEPTPPNAAANFARTAISDFGLRPQGAPGTSVVIPHPMNELADPANLAYAVIRQYFHPIIAGDLAVEIVAAQGSARIDADTIIEEAHRTGDRDADNPEERAEAMVRAIELAEWGRRVGEWTDADARRGQPAIAPEEAAILRDRYQNGERLAFRVQCKVRRQSNTFQVFVEKDDELSAGHDFYVRGHLHIPGMDYLTKHRARALVVVDNTSGIGHLLRDAEGPSHERWRADAPRLKERGWPAGATRVREVQNAAVRILDKLAEKPAKVSRDALADLFPGAPGKPGPGPKPPKPLPPPPPPPPPPFRVNRIPNGFELKPVGSRDLSGAVLEVRMAYDVARGTTKTAFSRFERGLRAGCPDFSLRDGRLRVEGRGCGFEIVSPNAAHVFARAAEFSFAVTGFDERDVVVDVAEIAAEFPEPADESARAPDDPAPSGAATETGP